MREILFRGKRIDNGAWVEGFYYEDIAGNSVILSRPRDFCYADAIDAVPSTVGQYTGLTDKNGKRIFEGDILHISRIADGLGIYYHPPLDYPVNVVVKWDLCAWLWETLCEDKRYITFPDAWCQYECEVIGNIHDNQEFMKEGADNGS